ncbi:MAG: CHAP domain-containing protein [Acidimicrobiia bacterium]
MPAAVAAGAKKVAGAAAKRAAQGTASRFVGPNEEPRRWATYVVVALLASPVVAMVGTVVLFTSLGPPAEVRRRGCGPGRPVPTSADVAPGTLEAVNALKSSYEKAGATTGVPWTLLAAVDYRESNNDPDRSALSGEPIGEANPDNPSTVTSSKLDSLERAGNHLKAMASSVYGVELTPSSPTEDVKAALLAYNRGSIYKQAGASWDLSPYVMNQFDAAHTDMVWPAIAGEPLAGRTEYGRYGGWTLFVRLGGSSADGCAGLSDDEIVRIAQQQLGLREVPDGCNCGPEIQKFLGSSAGEAWCADFVSWVYREAGHPFSGGVDGGWRLPGVTGLRAWLERNGIWHNRGERDTPRPGDVIVFGDEDHTGIVERLDDAGTPTDPSDDVIHTVEGNTSNEVGRRSYWLGDAQVLGWGRMRSDAAQPPVAA